MFVRRKKTFLEKLEQTLWEPIQLWCWVKPRNFLRKVNNVLTWTWNYFIYVSKNDDFDWDFEFLLDLMSWKMTRMANYFERQGVADDFKRCVKQLRYAVYLIERIKSEADEDILDAKHKERWGERELIFKNDETIHTLPDGTKLEGRTFNMRYSKVKTKKEHDQAEEELFNILRGSNKKTEELRNRLFRHISYYHTNWWD